MAQISQEEPAEKIKGKNRQYPVWILNGLVDFRPREPKTVVECYDGDCTNRMMSDDEDDEREDVASV